MLVNIVDSTFEPAMIQLLVNKGIHELPLCGASPQRLLPHPFELLAPDRVFIAQLQDLEGLIGQPVVVSLVGPPPTPSAIGWLSAALRCWAVLHTIHEVQQMRAGRPFWFVHDTGIEQGL